MKEEAELFGERHEQEENGLYGRNHMKEEAERLARPESILNTGEYVEPFTFENDRESILFDAYCYAMNYIEQATQRLEEVEEDVKDRQILLDACKRELDKKEAQLKDAVDKADRAIDAYEVGYFEDAIEYLHRITKLKDQ